MIHLYKNFVAIFLGIFIMFFQGCESKNSNQDKVIKIGAVLPITGSMAKYGKSSQQALELALSEINHKNKIVELIIEDSALEPKKALSAIKKLIDIDHIQGVVGPIASSETQAVVSTVMKNKTILMSPGSSAPSLSDAGEYIFRTVPSDTLEGSYMANYLYNTLHKKSMAIYYIQNGFGEGIKNVFVKKYKELGGKITTVEKFELNQQKHETALLKVKSTNPEGIYIIGYSEMVSIFNQAYQQNLQLSLYATTMLNDQSMVDKIDKKAVEGTVFASWDFSNDSKDKSTKEFIDKFKKAYGYQPDVFAANSYDALKILTNALKNDSSLDYIHNIQDYKGASGSITFNKNGDVVKPMVIKVVENGKIK